MQNDFWHQRWQNNQIGFHSEVVNPYLQRFWSSLSLKPESKVFIPLCGKTKDMLWLLTQGYHIIGVELSSIALDAFFSENNLHASIRPYKQFIIHETDRLQLFCGDFFQLTPEDLGQVDMVYDRAALVALPPDMRINYVNHLSSLLQPNQQILLVTFDYLQHEMSGPPFSISDDEVDLLFQHWCSVELLTSEDVLHRELHFKERG